jgi:hypothetical protein
VATFTSKSLLHQFFGCRLCQQPQSSCLALDYPTLRVVTIAGIPVENANCKMGYERSLEQNGANNIIRQNRTMAKYQIMRLAI